MDAPVAGTKWSLPRRISVAEGLLANIGASCPVLRCPSQFDEQSEVLNAHQRPIIKPACVWRRPFGLRSRKSLLLKTLRWRG
jgi:hypothetical protein